MNDYAVRQGAVPDVVLRDYVKSGVVVQCSSCETRYDIYQPKPHEAGEMARSKPLWLDIELRRHHRAGMPHPDVIQFPAMFYKKRK